MIQLSIVWESISMGKQNCYASFLKLDLKAGRIIGEIRVG